jgi:hypothetical protein
MDRKAFEATPEVDGFVKTGEWLEIFPDLTLDECLAAVRDDPWFQP